MGKTVESIEFVGRSSVDICSVQAQGHLAMRQCDLALLKEDLASPKLPLGTGPKLSK